MDVWAILSISLFLALLFCGTLAFLWGLYQKTLTAQRQAMDTVTSMQTQTLELLTAALSRTTDLLASGDVMTFQQLQATTPSEYDNFQAYDPSDEGEIDRIRSKNKDQAAEGDLSDYERGIYESDEPELFQP